MRNALYSRFTPQNIVGNLFSPICDAFPRSEEVLLGEKTNSRVLTFGCSLRYKSSSCSRYATVCFILQKTSKFCLFWVWVVFGLSGCLNTKTLPIKTVFVSQTCNIEAGIIPIKNQKELNDTFLRFSSETTGRSGCLGSSWSELSEPIRLILNNN